MRMRKRSAIQLVCLLLCTKATTPSKVNDWISYFRQLAVRDPEAGLVADILEAQVNLDKAIMEEKVLLAMQLVEPEGLCIRDLRNESNWNAKIREYRQFISEEMERVLDNLTIDCIEAGRNRTEAEAALASAQAAYQEYKKRQT